MNYLEVTINIAELQDFHRDIIADSLATIGFETFEESPQGIKAFIQEQVFNPTLFQATLQELETYCKTSYQVQQIENQNWNQLWESNFEPILIADLCYVRASFHEAKKGSIPYEIVIDPKMAFGTGHHQTTSLMLCYLLEMDLIGKTVLDMGCGTGILAIMASKLGAKIITAIDYDPICYDSVQENAERNNIHNIKALCGSKEVIPNQMVDVIIANINRNILLEQMESYVKILNKTGCLLISGFFITPDLDILKEHAISLGLEYLHHKEESNWVAAYFVPKR